MPTLEQFLETQNQGITQNPYKYNIVDISHLYNTAKNGSETDIYNARNGIMYSILEDIPKNLYNRIVYRVTPGITETGCLYLRIAII